MSDQTWFTVAEAADYTRRHPKTVLNALESTALMGYQNGRRGRWSIHRDDLDAWVMGKAPSKRLRPVQARSA